jgi:hypothetical protein
MQSEKTLDEQEQSTGLLTCVNKPTPEYTIQIGYEHDGY